MEADVVVVGSGAAGLTAAIVSAKSGLSVIVLESTRFFGGTTAYSGGGVWIPGNHHMEQAGFSDSRGDATAYLKATVGDYYDQEKIDVFLDMAPEMLRYMENNSEVRLTASSIPDYYPDVPGWKISRGLTTVDYDGSRLGSHFHDLRPPLPELCLFGSMQLSGIDAYRMQNWMSSAGNLRFTARRMAKYWMNRLVGARDRHLANGNALAGRLLKSAIDAGVILRSNTRARRLLRENGRIVGVAAEVEGRTDQIEVRRGVVLASGGFGANEEMRRKYLPQAEAGWTLQPEGNRGDGINMGIDMGGMLDERNAANGIWTPASTFMRKDGSRALFPSFVFDRHCPGSIMVDARTGRRFVDESTDYQKFGNATSANGVDKMWMISDSLARRRYGIGAAKPAPFSVRPWIRRGYLIEAPTIGKLAARIGIAPAVLERTIRDFNDNADAGKDPEFHRGQNYYSRYMGDATHEPNPSLGALRFPPFYALEVRPCDISTLVGLSTNAKAQVLDRAGQPIDGLYAVGLDGNAIMRGRYPGAGCTIGPAMTFGYVVARQLAATPPEKSRQSNAETARDRH